MRVRKMIGAVAGLAMLGALMASAASAQSPTTVTITADNAGILELSISTPHTMDFQNIGPDGRNGGNTFDFGGSIGEGAYYCSNPRTVTVIANQDWELSLDATVDGGNTGMDFNNLALNVPPSDCDDSNVPVEFQAPADFNMWGPPGLTTFSEVLTDGENNGPAGDEELGRTWIRSLWSNNPGAFSAELVFSVVATP